MAITIDWATYTINIPRADMILVQSTPIEVRQLDLATFHETLRDLEDDPAGMPQPVTHNYKAPLTISGVTLAQVVEVLDPYSLTFEDGQYAVNITGGNSNLADKVNINNVGVRTANSAGLQDAYSLQAASFNNGSVAVNPNSTYTGTKFPVGTRAFPVNNLADAHDIAEERGLTTVEILSDITITSGSFIDGYTFRGDNPNRVTITIDPAAEISNATFTNCKVTGTLDNNNVIRECIVLDIFHINGYIDRCSIIGDVTLGAGTTCVIVDSFSGTPHPAEGVYPYIIWPSGVHCDLVVTNYSGNLGLGGCDVSAVAGHIEITSGDVHIESDLAAGTFYVYGNGDIEYEAGYGATIVDETNASRIAALTAAVWDQPAAAHDAEGTFGHYVQYLRFMPKYVFVDTEALTNGDGSQDHPFNNVTDAMDKAEEDHATTIVLTGDIILDRNLKNIEIRGIGVPEVDLNGKDVRNARFYQVRLKGDHINAITAQECVLADGLTLNGFFENCAAYGTLNCPVGSVAFVKGVATGLAGAAPVTINMNSGGAANLTVVDYHGALTITNCDSVADVVTVDMTSGVLTFASSCTLGTMIARGNCTFIDNTSGATVIDETLSATSVWEYTA